VLTGNTNPCELGQSFRRAFSALGHEADLFDWYGRISAWTARAPNRISRVVLTAAARRKAALELVALVRRRQPDVLLLLKTDDIPHGAIELLRLAAPQCIIAAFHPDDPFNIDRLRGPSHPRSLYVMDSVDHYFIWSERLVPRIHARASRDVSYLGFACDPDFTRPLSISREDRQRFGCEVSFVGNWDPKREAWVAAVAHLSGISLAIWGTSAWNDRARDPRVRACWRGDVALGDDFVKAVSCSRVSLNVLRIQNETAENMRTYEIPACGALMLSEWSEQQARVFRPGKEAAYGNSPQHYAAALEQLLSRPDSELEVMRVSALKRSQLHTYTERAARALAAIGLTPTHAA
jgi:hypothetical protein